MKPTKTLKNFKKEILKSRQSGYQCKEKKKIQEKHKRKTLSDI